MKEDTSLLKIRNYVFLLLLISPSFVSGDDFKIGAGIWDITGPTAEIGMMGYAMMDQVTAGLHFRLRARAFVFGTVSNPNDRIVFVNTDSCMMFGGLKQTVIQNLNAKYGNLYHDENVLISGIHTHAGPAGYSFELLYNIMSWGFHKPNFDVIVDGIVSAISMAHNKYEQNKGAKILLNSGELLHSNINRSPTAYLANPAEERAKYNWDVDKEMVLLRFEDLEGNEIGLLNWFAVHGTSMTNQNHLVSGDNKGTAAYLFERLKNGNSSVPGMGPFVAAFAQTNEGDVSPNTRGAFCDNGRPCETAHSTCGGSSQNCHGYGPGKDDFESTMIIGTHQADFAQHLYDSAKIQVESQRGVDFRLTYLDMSDTEVSGNFTTTGKPGRTCHGSLGDAFAAGTTDGPGDFDFVQGTNSTSTNPYWNYIGSFLSNPSQEEKACQAPKPILLNVGDVEFPGPWIAKIIPVQLLRLGNFYIVGVPGEFSTMSGRRLRETVLKAIVSAGGDPNSKVVIAGLSNDYTHYITTFEEYGIQRYEGASTLYGPHTLAAYQQTFSELAVAMVTGDPVPHGPNPPDLSSDTWSFQPGVIFDAGSFGKIYTDVDSAYKVGDVVSVVFYGANPRNDFKTQSTYLTVERMVNGNWEVYRVDGDWDTRFHWQSHLIAESLITIEWFIGDDAPLGTYRIRNFGTSKDIFGTLTPYTGTSSSFVVQ
eukprot:TRINITY_DN14980_c0_g1_i1.p1 TRINITY_DN14980_c0_g1~~TRINITY_DN14980_c0_g1_i1.p1  ORF type:complete len:704 (-),score=205.22 TRINITY_DN14980_c0_g1_i1:76-2187(-)